MRAGGRLRRQRGGRRRACPARGVGGEGGHGGPWEPGAGAALEGTRNCALGETPEGMVDSDEGLVRMLAILERIKGGVIG
jgi:hypothetical protein